MNPEESKNNEYDAASIEAKLIEQDHRVFRVLWTFFWERRQWDKDDPRRKAALHAFLWQFLTPGSIVATGGGLIAVFTLVVLVQQTEFSAQQTVAIRTQTELFQKQNDLFTSQNTELKKQISLQKSQFETSRTTDLLTFLFDGKKTDNRYDCLEGRTKPYTLPSYNERIRSDAFKEYYDLSSNSDELVNLENAVLSGIDLRNKSFKKVNLRCADFSQSWFFGVGYKDEVMLTWANFSSSYIEDVTFKNSDIRWANFKGATITATRFLGVSAHNINFEGASISNTNLNNLDLRSSSFKDATLNNVDFSNSYLDGVNFIGAKCRNCNFEGAKGKVQNGYPEKV